MQTTSPAIGGSEAAAEAAPLPLDSSRRVRRYCTYFDGHYALRALVMIESLRRHEPDAAIHALCLDETAARIIRDRAPATNVTTLAELEAFDPELAAAKSNRSSIEFFFTCTPCFPRYLLHRHPDTDSITYLDADMVFFESPARIFEETGDASVAIVPHNFTPPLAARTAYGVYNVSWVMWRNDAEGRRCLDDYRVDCLRWCHDRLEAGRFADQKYLDAWPERYRGVHVVRGKGVNLAVWNADNYDLRRDDGKMTVDGEPLVLFHGHAVTHVGPARYELRFADYGVRRNAAFLQDVLYKPYILRINQLFNDLAGTYGLTIAGDVRGRQSLEAAPGAGVISGGYAIVDRETAAGAEDAWRHDDVAAWQDRVYARILDEARAGRLRVDLAVAADAVRAAGVAAPSLLEIGCGGGHYAAVFRLLLGAEVAYAGIDSSPAMIALARRSHPKVAFTIGDATALPFADASFDIAFNGAALMHILDYRRAVAESRRIARRACIFHTVPLVTHRPTTYLRKQAYGRTTGEVLFNRDELFALFAASGLVVRREWDSMPYDLGPLVGGPTLSRTILCEVVG